LQERGSAGSENKEEFAGVAFGAGEVNWWSSLEERESIKPEKPKNIPCYRLFAITETKKNRNGIKRRKTI
jgi:hypothetical protein